MIPELLYTPLKKIYVRRPQQDGTWHEVSGVQLELSDYEFQVLVTMAERYRHLEPQLPQLNEIELGGYNGPR